MDNLKKGTILLAILLTMSSVNGSCFLESLGTYPCTGRVVCLEDLELAVSLVRDWQCRRHESYDYQYSSYRRVRIDEDYDISIYASEIDTATKFNPYSAVNILTDHIIQMSLVNSNETTVPAAISSLRRATSIDLSQNAIESISLGAFSRTNLKQLNVSHNIIATLEVGDGPVDNNNLSAIEEKNFNMMTTLDTLNISSNREFAAANIKEISIGGNLISCDTLTNLKKKERTGLIVTAKNENYHAENVDGITCRNVSISIEHFVDAFNKSEAANSVFLSKLMEINNGTNWYLGNIEKFLKEHNNDSAGDKSYIGTELKDKDIEKILSGMLVEQRESLRTEFKGMLDDLKSNNVGNNQMASQTTDIKE
ncbi:hypothetical protein MSG28_008457 [Choristoneura fumiferana]|uniref:Uncharacterized protein n=1 Tax=Choristoneura fumiferana TaxID=7141 RepID=A0ACC0J6G7_CHOFU|nr:hypothetical protein MSG28_008457 [Choristoneura fumiferana]